MQRLAVYTLGFLQVPYIRKMLRISGWRVGLGPFLFRANAVGVWGRKPRARRGIKAAERRGLTLLSIEDAFLRSVHPGPKSAPAGLVLADISAPMVGPALSAPRAPFAARAPPVLV